ncbi:MAG: RibD family protein [Acidobacteria bacterium]|nr:RibD family protein [Acidobacteriota bacterium]
MNISAPVDLSPFDVLFDHSEKNVALTHELRQFAGNVGFPAAPAGRPWIYANFVQSIDGMVSFGGTHPGGEWIARSRHDRWMMDLLRAHADALICGMRSLEMEARFGRIPGGPVYRIVDPGLLRYRTDVLGRRKLINIIVSGTGKFRPTDYRLFSSEHVEAWIATTPEGARHLEKAVAGTANVRLLVCGENGHLDWTELMKELHRSGIEQLLCEGGPALYGSMLRSRLIDEKFLTISPQEIGAEHPAPEESRVAEEMFAPRLTSFTGAGFGPENAQWYRTMSCRRAGDHMFLRYRAAAHPDQR